MAEPFLKFPIGSSSIKGYLSDKVNCPPDYISSPSKNVLINENGKVESRMGHTNEFTIGVSNRGARSAYLKTYDVSFYALGTKVYYRDHTNLVTYDTGITLTDGTVTRVEIDKGDVYLSNTTDGFIRICVGRLNDSAANSGDNTFTIDSDFLGRMAAFGDTSGNFRMKETDESVASFVVDTGVCTHSTTLSQNYADNTIVIFVDNSYSGLPKPSKVLHWEGRTHLMGVLSASDSDRPLNTVYSSKFVLGEAGSTTMENAVSFPLDGTSGSQKTIIHDSSDLANILGVKETMYFFTKDKTFSVHKSEITTGYNEVTYSTTSIGAMFPTVIDQLNGCANEDSATAMGKNELGFITNNKRIMRIRISPETGSADPYSDESFDTDIRQDLENMDNDQTGSIAFHYSGQRKTIFQVKIKGQWVWFIFDHNIQRKVGSTIIQGAWQAPLYMPPVASFFERNGVLWGTDASADTVYTFFTAFTDDLSGFDQTIATGEFNIGNSMVKQAQVQGDVNQPSQINIRCYVTNEASGRRAGSAKVINGNAYDYTQDESIGALPVGEAGGVGETTLIAKWRRSFGVFPSEATRTQLILTNDQEGGYMSMTSYQIDGIQYPNTSTARL